MVEKLKNKNHDVLKTFLEFFTTDSNKSMTRLLFFLAINASIVIGILGICLGRDLLGIAGIITALSATTGTVKFVQSKYEEENSTDGE